MNDKIVQAAAAIQKVLDKGDVTLLLDLTGYPTLCIVDDITREKIGFIEASKEAEKRRLHSVQTPKS